MKKIERIDQILANLENFNRCVSEPVLRKEEHYKTAKELNWIVDADIEQQKKEVVVILYRMGFINPKTRPDLFLLYENESDTTLKVIVKTRHDDYYGTTKGAFIIHRKHGKEAYERMMNNDISWGAGTWV